MRVAVFNAAIDILSTRLLALLAEIGAIGMWSYSVYDPTRDRLWVALGYSLTVLVPLIYVHYRKE